MPDSRKWQPEKAAGAAAKRSEKMRIIIEADAKEIAELLLRIESRPVPTSGKEILKIIMDAISAHSDGSSLREVLQSAEK